MDFVEHVELSVRSAETGRAVGKTWLTSSIRLREEILQHMSYSLLNSLKGGYIGEYIGDYYRGH